MLTPGQCTALPQLRWPFTSRSLCRLDTVLFFKPVILMRRPAEERGVEIVGRYLVEASRIARLPYTENMLAPTDVGPGLRWRAGRGHVRATVWTCCAHRPEILERCKTYRISA